VTKSRKRKSNRDEEDSRMTKKRRCVKTSSEANLEQKKRVEDYPTKKLPLKTLLTEKNAPKWWEMNPYKGDIKWKRLDHNGICFPPPYKQHHVKIKYKGKPVLLNASQEELATFYAVMLETEWVKRKAFNTNFFREFRIELKNAKEKRHRHTFITNFKELDFRPIYE